MANNHSPSSKYYRSVLQSPVFVSSTCCVSSPLA
uniref:Uncharacterized protein n=1 Tax=Ascaris lumbricoides TaxID=6252 RepID=A0A0M3HYF3_ASCLU